jgi:hypothetical protein
MNGIDFSQFMEWFTNPLLFVPAIVYFVDKLRKALPAIDGQVVVGVATVAVGVALGLVGGALNAIDVEPFANLSQWVGGLTYGIAGGLTAFLGVNIFDFAVGRLGKR